MKPGRLPSYVLLYVGEIRYPLKKQTNKQNTQQRVKETTTKQTNKQANKQTKPHNKTTPIKRLQKGRSYAISPERGTKGKI